MRLRYGSCHQTAASKSIQPWHYPAFNKGIAIQLIARTYWISLSLINLLPSHPTVFVSPKCYNSKIACKLPNGAARWLIKHAGPSLIILAINIDKPVFLFFFVGCECVSNRVKNQMFWSIQKASYNLSSYGRERELVTQELFQAVYNLISDQSQRVFPGGLGAIDPKNTNHMI